MDFALVTVQVTTQRLSNFKVYKFMSNLIKIHVYGPKRFDDLRSYILYALNFIVYFILF